ncbi:ArsR family transcriptional regulator, cadmium/lead-responsive transcriptional repressor [Frankia sp. AiPs1]|uniref:ArsR/SmtB family transcription factor n=1 Tax=Frankia sp. AiPa1 TaxID=573492 RepID=UPI00202AE919|nr:metalloregulator ArsR/SmtB family transcription factor [Frankia sp. AiPa1]MCL9762312.1 metalloregulator ArsR/SmtB family transcription factor [Frankia sp. AiPa1]
MVTAASSAEVLARFGHALSDPTRARLLLVLRSGGAYPSQLAEVLGVSRTNLSNHLACLRGCGLVVATPEGRRQRYELADGKLRHALGDLLEVVLAVDPDHLHAFVADLDPDLDPDVDPGPAAGVTRVLGPAAADPVTAGTAHADGRVS